MHNLLYPNQSQLIISKHCCNQAQTAANYCCNCAQAKGKKITIKMTAFCNNQEELTTWLQQATAN